MDLRHTLSDKKLTIELPQRLDTTAAAVCSEVINGICRQQSHGSLVLDAGQMEYISSSGLRVMLALARQEVDFCIRNASDSVYKVFEMTGFVRLLQVERALPQVSIEGCPEIGRGGVGTVYRLNDETIIKVFRAGTPLEEVQQEINLSREAFVLGMPTAISFQTVRVGERYGLVHELINAQTLSATIMAQPERAEEYGRQLGRLMRQIHSIEVPAGRLPDAVEVTHRKLERIRRYFKAEEVDVLSEIFNAIPRGNRLLHCDLHPKNVMVSNGELILIDMGEVCVGNPLQDLSHTYSSMKGLVGDYESLIGMREDLCACVFDAAMQSYAEGMGASMPQHWPDQLRVASYVRNFSWLSLSDSFPEEVIRSCRRVLRERVMDHLPEIRAVLPGFNQWK